MFTPSYQNQLSVNLKYRVDYTLALTYGCVENAIRHSYIPALRRALVCLESTGTNKNVADAMFAVVAFAHKATAGSFVLYYEGHPTTTLSHDASAANVKAALSAIPAVQGVNVDFSIPLNACNSAAINVIQVGHPLLGCWSCGKRTWVVGDWGNFLPKICLDLAD